MNQVVATDLSLHLPRPRILVVDDEMMVAMHIEDILLDLGYEVVKAARLVKALHIAETQRIAGAFLDVSIFGTPVFPLADALIARAISFAFVTGHEPGHISAQYGGIPVLAKPIVERKIGGMAAAFVGRVENRTARLPAEALNT